MPGPRAIRIFISPTVRTALEALARSATTHFRDVLRARIILAAGSGMSNEAVARAVGCNEHTVRKWRKRFSACSSTMALADLARSGRPPTVTVETRCEVIKLACRRPSEKPPKKKVHAPFRNVWTLASLRDAVEREVGVSLSVSEIRRILRSEGLRPHKMQLWLHSPDPHFREKVRRICDLYRSPPAGSHVVCVDEKTSIQALSRKHPTKLPGPGRAGRQEFEYVRHSTRALLAAFDIRDGKVFGQCRARRTAADLDDFMEALARRYPTGDVYVVWDNLNTHCGDQWEAFSRRHGGRFHFVHTPLHASWVNQVEIWFGILQRRLLRYGEFTSVEDLSARIEGFIAHWNRFEAHPFRWTFRGRFSQHPEQRAA